MPSKPQPFNMPFTSKSYKLKSTVLIISMYQRISPISNACFPLKDNEAVNVSVRHKNLDVRT